MPKIIVLYILKQVTKTIFFTFLILFGILFFNESIQFLEKAARGDLYPSLLIPVLFFSLPAILEVSVPISVFLGILISIYNLNKTNELSFIYQLGMGQKNLTFITLIPVIFCSFFIFFNSNNNFSLIFLSICSSISNIGFSFDVPQNLSFIFLILIIIGGSFFSTSSGLRFSKLFLLFKFSINELISHAKPKNVYSNKLPFFNINLGTEDYYKYFLSVVIFVISLSILSLFLTVSGISSEISFKLSILTLMNTVNSPLTNLENFNFYDLGVFSKFSLILFMMIGRVELLSILIILKKFFFKS